MAYSSERLFCSGVPLNSTRLEFLEARTSASMVLLPEADLMRCPSSATRMSIEPDSSPAYFLRVS